MQWYEYPRVDNYGMFPDPFGPYPKPDSNIECPPNIDVTSLASGHVSGVNHNPAWGIGTVSVTVKLDTPINAIATHMAYNFLSSASVKVGDTVQPGTLLGKSSSIYGFGLAFALCNDDIYGTGNFSKYAGDKRLDPVPTLNAAKSGGPMPTTTTNNSSGSVSSSAITTGAIGLGIVLLFVAGIAIFALFVGVQ